ncbi:GspH/FimT family pseudopilin [bacterium 19MO03SA05]|uniref:GspH/FimT family pseudopilin n=1 Tax=bacterium 19MO03SA05 TaxID=2920620 RepID=A0AAU6VB27_UNCXX|nr:MULTISPECIES: GspH/FimT family pseudopilin [unclassified Vibrio]EKO3708603.1 GspH/FimT family pseudopilin [Vibrio metschnikovii]EKO3921443.1 GspH/FimT family pseudopilin [Vibrio metschnikovii]MDQ2109760.1 prepilin-type N-terminal cleavage/methylation domain-containing protein [Vibrio sp. 2017_1457_15]MDQ2161934.1 prepilin-type N-terminal cleavage/methylation domain-containing protein [Vibrio sp. 2017_1457_13]MDQ2194191.1 prepilin-type N-terminal cleavage/methylation domain-containing protei
MVRGFTLLELLITVSIVTLMLAFAAPSYRQVNQQIKMTALANDLHGFFMQAKSEAVFRNQDVWLHVEGMPSNTGEWRLLLFSHDSQSTLHDSAPSLNSERVISVLSGDRYHSLSVSYNSRINPVKFEHVMGNPTSAGSITIQGQMNDSQGIKVMFHNGAGRVRICSIQGELYGFSAC